MKSYIGANKSEIADVVIITDDSLRTKLLAEKHLENPELVNNNRLNLGYTGTYKNTKVTIFTSGIGMPSMGIYAKELFENYNIKRIIKIGECDSYHEEISIDDIILTEKAYTLSNFAKQYNNEDLDICKSSVLLSQKIVNVAHASGIEVKIGTIHTSDTNNSDEIEQRVKDNYCLARDMETFALLYIAKQHDKQAASLLGVTKNLATKDSLNEKEINEMYDKLMKLSLESIIKTI